MANKNLEAFLKMPQRSQELFFEYLERYPQFNDVSKIFLNKNIMGEEFDSPIEQIFFMAFEIVNYIMGTFFFLDFQTEIECENGKKYYADFLYETLPSSDDIKPIRLIIECDGHDFHEKTKEQVQHNNERDMDLKMEGFEIIHFSGSQIFKSPIKCAYETVNYILKKEGRDASGV